MASARYATEREAEAKVRRVGGRNHPKVSGSVNVSDPLKPKREKKEKSQGTGFMPLAPSSNHSHLVASSYHCL